MIAVATPWTQVEGYCITAYNGIALGETFTALLRNAEDRGANAVLGTCFDDAVDVGTLYHGAAVVIKPVGIA